MNAFNTMDLLNQIKLVQGDDFVRDIQNYIMDRYFGSIDNLGDDIVVFVEPHGGWLRIKKTTSYGGSLFWINNRMTAIEFLAEIAADDNGMRTGDLYLAALNLVCEYFSLGAHTKLITYTPS